MTIHIRAADSGSKNGYARGICGQVRPRVLVPTLKEWRAYPEGRLCRRCIQIGSKAPETGLVISGATEHPSET